MSKRIKSSDATVAGSKPQERRQRDNTPRTSTSTNTAPRDAHELVAAPEGKMKILAIDIETAPAIVYTFSLFKPFIGIDQIIEPSRIICFSAQWTGTKKTMFKSEYHHSREEMMQALWDLLDQADAVLTYNGNRFDVPWISGELITEGFTPPSPYKKIDLYQVVRSNMRSLSNKLDYISQRLLGDRKTPHTGFRLWKECLEGDAKAWALMKKYSIQDTKLMLPLYEKLKPWIKGHPHAGLHNGKVFSCPNCGSTKVQRRGTSVTGVSKFQRFQCQDCGAWSRDTAREEGVATRPAT